MSYILKHKTEWWRVGFFETQNHAELARLKEENPEEWLVEQFHQPGGNALPDELKETHGH